MSSGFVLLFIVLAVLTGSLYFLIQAEGGIDEIGSILERAGLSVGEEDTDVDKGQPASLVPPEFTSGSSRFSQGTCQNDVDCYVGGCSEEVCSSEEGVVTTCEIRNDFPGPEMSCGCVQQVCGWQ